MLKAIQIAWKYYSQYDEAIHNYNFIQVLEKKKDNHILPPEIKLTDDDKALRASAELRFQDFSSFKGASEMTKDAYLYAALVWPRTSSELFAVDG